MVTKKLTRKQIDAKWESYNQWQQAKLLGDDIRRERRARARKKKKVAKK